MKELFIDFDGVIVNTVKAIVDLYNDDHVFYENFKWVNWTDIDSWEFEELELADYSYIDKYFDQPRFFKRLEWMDNSREVLRRLKEDYEIIVVSVGSYPNLQMKKIWVKAHMPYASFIGINYDKGEDKSIVDMSDGIFIDDSTSNLVIVNAPKCICFGDVYSWNKDWDGERCYNWYDVDRYLKRGGDIRGKD